MRSRKVITTRHTAGIMLPVSVIASVKALFAFRSSFSYITKIQHRIKTEVSYNPACIVCLQSTIYNVIGSIKISLKLEFYLILIHWHIQLDVQREEKMIIQKDQLWLCVSWYQLQISTVTNTVRLIASVTVQLQFSSFVLAFWSRKPVYPQHARLASFIHPL